MPRALSTLSPCPPPGSSHTPQLLTQLACPRGSCTSREGDCSPWGTHGSSFLSLVLLGILALARWSVGPKLFSPTYLSSHFFPHLFPLLSGGSLHGRAWMGEGRVIGGSGGHRASGVGSDTGDVVWALDRWVDIWSWCCSGALGWLGFPSLAPGNLGSEPRIPVGSSPFPLSLDSAGPQSCIPATPLALGGLRWASPIRNFSWGRHRGQGFQDFMVNSTIRNGPLCLAQPCHLARVSVGLGCGISHRSVRAAQVKLLGTPWPHPQYDSTHCPASPGPDSPATIPCLEGRCSGGTLGFGQRGTMGRGNSLSDPELSVSESLSRWGTLRFVCCLLGWSSCPSVPWLSQGPASSW